MSLIIKTKNFLLRPVVSSDVDNIFLGLSDPNVSRFYGDHYSSVAEAKEQMDWFRELEERRTGQWWTICSLDGKIFHGACGFHEWNHEHHRAEIGFWLLHQYWGKGVMQEALRGICEYGFSEMNLHRIEGLADTPNMNSLRLFKKLGFTHEGTKTDCEYKNGAFLSHNLFSKIKGQ